MCPCAATSFPLSFHHTPCRYHKAKAHKQRQLVKRYLAGKTKWKAAVQKRFCEQLAARNYGLQQLAAHDAAVLPTIVSPCRVPPSESKAAVVESLHVPASPKKSTPIKPPLSPGTCTKIANSRAAAEARRAARMLEEAERGACLLCGASLTVLDTENMCADCQHASCALRTIEDENVVVASPPAAPKKTNRATKKPKVYDV